jgi:hypothetical protein
MAEAISLSKTGKDSFWKQDGEGFVLETRGDILFSYEERPA